MSDYFGQSPDGYQKPLYGASNLSDVVDKPAALVNLGAASADDVLKAANPIGTIIAFYGSVAPYGYLPCNGQIVSSSTFPSLVTFLGGTTAATLPDLRGEFLRGWDNGRGIDTGRAIRTWQKGTMVSADTSGSGDGSTVVGLGANAALPLSSYGIDTILLADYPSQVTALSSASTTATSVTVSGSTRPRNISVLYCIKAYDTPVSASILNVAQLASDLTSQVSLKTALSDFTGTNQSFGTTGWQKLPGGFIIQWGNIIASASDTVTTIPMAFPNSFHKVMVCTAYTAGSGSIGYISASPTSNSTFTSRGSSAGLGCTFIALGN